MYFIFVYDHKYMKSDRDFFGDAIVSFHPVELKETYVFLLGQLIGTIEFAKTLAHADLNQIRLDKLVLTYKPLNAQFSLVLATSQTTLLNELTLKKRLVIVYNLIKTVHGPFQAALDRDENRIEYERFKTRVNELTLSCFNLVFKPSFANKRTLFNSYFSNITLDLQYKLESRCKYLVEYSMKKLRAFQGVLFYDDKILYSKTRDHLMLNIIYFLISEESDLLSKCDTVEDISADLPSGCQLVQVSLSGALLSQMKKQQQQYRGGGSNNPSSESSYVELDEEELDDEDHPVMSSSSQPLIASPLDSLMSQEAEITMDMLPESTRFVTSEYLMTTTTKFDNDENNDELVMADNDNYDESDDNNNNSNSYRRITLYIQKNSRLKLVLLCMTNGSINGKQQQQPQQHQFKLDNIIRIWQNIVTNFSSLELGLLDENNKNSSNCSSPMSETMSLNQFDPLETGEALSSMESPLNAGGGNAIGFRSSTICSCLVDRNRCIKYSTSSTSSSHFTSRSSQSSQQQQQQQLQTNSALLNQPTALVANMNLFYELMGSLPELSRMEINKKGCTFSLLRQNMATVLTRTLDSNVTIQEKGQQRVRSSTRRQQQQRQVVVGDFELVDKPTPTTTTTTRSSLHRRTSSILSSDGFMSSSNNKQLRSSPDTLSTTSSYSPMSTSTAATTTAGHMLNYGDVIIKCELGPIVS